MTMRFAIRPHDGKATVVLGAVTPDALDALNLKTHTVYEVVSLLGAPVIREVGPCAMAPERWGRDVSALVREDLAGVLMTTEEREEKL